MSIFGEPFSPWVKEQIETRQKILGTSTDPHNLQVYNTKTPWIRLASSINLSNTSLYHYDHNPFSINIIPNSNYSFANLTPTPKVNDPSSIIQKLLSENWPVVEGSDLARNCILFGGAVSDGLNNGEYKYLGLNSGINSQEFNNQGSYGWLGTSERGYIPLPGITQATTKYLNNGTLAESTISIKCFSKNQLQIIDILYMRPGYTLLLEFGWSHFFDKNNTIQKMDTFHSDPLIKFLKGINQDEMYEVIDVEKKDKKGNYEAILGKVSNFSWALDNDGSYSCEITITSVGDIIESLKAGINVGWGEDEDKEDEDNVLISNRDRSFIDKLLYDASQLIPQYSTEKLKRNNKVIEAK